MAYSSASDVAALTQNLIAPEYTYTTSTSPTLFEVEMWLSSGCSIIESTLLSEGYAVPVPSDSVAYGWVKELNTYYAVFMAEAARTNIVVGVTERTRGQLFERMFWKGLERICDMELTSMGLSRQNANATIYAGGISRASVEANRANEDRVPGRFQRDQFRFPGTERPDEVGRGDD